MEYTIKWKNQGGVKESGMSKWILQLHDDKGTPIKTKEDTTASNLENFSDVEIRMALTSEETMRQTTTNKMLIYFDRVSDSTKLGDMTVLFDRTRVPLNIASIVRSDITIPRFSLPVGSKITCSSNDPLGSGSYTYEYIGNSKIKYKPNESSTNKHECSDYIYTGVSDNSISTDGRCGIGKRCPGVQCCSTSFWCGGQKGEKSAWCSKKHKIDGNKYTWQGGLDFFDGIDINNFKMIKTEEVPGNSDCGPNYGKCSGNQCCRKPWWGSRGSCGGHKEQYSNFCSIPDKRDRGTYNWLFKGSWFEYDGSGVTPSVTTTMTSQKVVFKCQIEDPLTKNNETIYKWENNSLKNIASVPSGYSVYTIPSCDGIEYGGPG